MPELLSPQAKNDEIIRFVDNLIRLEAYPARRKREPGLDRNHRRYIGQHWDHNPPAGLKQFTINRTQRAILASVAVQTEQRPRTRLTPVESNDPPLVFASETGAAKLGQLGGEFGLTPAQMQGFEPFDSAIHQQLMALQVPVQAPAQTSITEEPGQDAEGNPVTQTTEETAIPQPTMQPVFGPEDFYLVDDKAAAEAMQVVYDVMWDRTLADYVWFDNILYKLVYGWQPMLVEWDADKHVYRLTNVHQKNVWIDPTSHGIEDADYIIFDEPMSADEAKARYPEYADVIDREKDNGQINGFRTGDADVELGAPYRETTFERDMVVLRTVWLRFQPVRMGEQEAVDNGVVVPAMTQGDGLDPATGQPIAIDVPAVFTDDDGNEKPIFQVAETGEVTEPEADNWPTKIGIRQIRIIGNTVVDDRECPFVDLPFAWNVNIPIPHSPYGMGEPDRLYDLQEFANRLISILHNHVKYYQSPQEYIPQSVKEANKDVPTHSHPGRRVIVPDDTYREFLASKRTGFAVDPPTIPAGYIELLQLTLSLLDEESDNSQVLQGRVPSGVESGRAIDMLQSAARGVIGFKSLYTERAIQQMAKLVIGMVKDFLPESEFMRMVSGYPPQVLMALRQRAKCLDYDIRVEVVSGKGANRRMNQQMAIEQFQLGLRGPTSTMKSLEIDDIPQEIADILSNPISPVAQAQAAAASQPPSGPNGSDSQ